MLSRLLHGDVVPAGVFDDRLGGLFLGIHDSQWISAWRYVAVARIDLELE